MRKETDLAWVKMIAHVLLDMPIAETSFSPAIVSHPFTSTGVTAAQNEDGNKSRSLVQGLFFDGLSEYEYADILGVSRAAIHKRKMRILKALKKTLKKFKFGGC